MSHVRRRPPFQRGWSSRVCLADNFCETVYGTTKLSFSEYKVGGGPGEGKQMVRKVHSAPAPPHDSLLFHWLLAGHEWRLLPGARSRGEAFPHAGSEERLAVCICASTPKYFWHHVCITPMQCYSGRFHKSSLSCYRAFSIDANVLGANFRNIVCPAGGK